MKNEEETDYVDEPKAEPTVSVRALFPICLLIAALGGGVGYLIHREPARTPDQASRSSDQVAIEQFKMQKAGIDLQGAQQKRFFDIQMKVVADCEARGSIPVLVNSNVDCHAPGAFKSEHLPDGGH